MKSIDRQLIKFKSNKHILEIMKSFCNYNCVNIIEEIKGSTSLVELRIENVTIHGLDDKNQTKQMDIQLEILIQCNGLKPNKETDLIYITQLTHQQTLFTVLKQKQMYYSQNELIDYHSVTLILTTNRFMQILWQVFPSEFIRLTILGARIDQQMDELEGSWNVFGTSEYLKLEEISDEEILVSSPFMNKSNHHNKSGSQSVLSFPFMSKSNHQHQSDSISIIPFYNNNRTPYQISLFPSPQNCENQNLKTPVSILKDITDQRNTWQKNIQFDYYIKD